MTTYYVEYEHPTDKALEAALVVGNDVLETLQSALKDECDRIGRIIFFSPLSSDADWHQNYLLETVQSGEQYIDYTRSGLMDMKTSFHNDGCAMALPRFRDMMRYMPEAAVNPIPFLSQGRVELFDEVIESASDREKLQIPVEQISLYTQSQIIIGIRQELFRRGLGKLMEG